MYEQFIKSEKLKVKSEELNYKPQTANYKLETPLFTFNSSLLTSIVPHAPYSTSLELMQLINEHSAGKVITIHNQETLEEERFFIKGDSEFQKLFKQFNIDISFYKPGGKTSLQTYLPYLNKASHLILVHNTFTNEEDVLKVNNETSTSKLTSSSQLETLSSAISQLSTFFCLCPNANLYIENALPPVELFRKHGCDIVVGTDSLASNHSLSILDELKTLHQHFPQVPLEELLQWATLNGAKALKMHGKLGSFEKGKQPGVVCIDGDLRNVRTLIGGIKGMGIV